MQYVLATVGLALAGIDPLGLSLLIAALAAGAKKPHVVVFSFATLIGTVALGVLFSLFGDHLAQVASGILPDVNDPIWAMVELIVAGVIVYWLVSSPKPDAEGPKSNEATSAPRGGSSVIGIAVSGLAFSLSAVSDPTFLATAAVASQAGGLFAMIGLHVLWVLISQGLLFGFAIAYLFDLHEPLVATAKPLWERLKRPLLFVLKASLAVFAIGLIADAVTLFATGAYLIPL